MAALQGRERMIVWLKPRVQSHAVEELGWVVMTKGTPDPKAGFEA
jgi:hypothetical protein